jgi:hypothetical protein
MNPLHVSLRSTAVRCIPSTTKHRDHLRNCAAANGRVQIRSAHALRYWRAAWFALLASSVGRFGAHARKYSASLYCCRGTPNGYRFFIWLISRRYCVSIISRRRCTAVRRLTTLSSAPLQPTKTQAWRRSRSLVTSRPLKRRVS